MYFLEALFTNKVLLAAFFAYFIAQVIKGILELIMGMKVSLLRFFFGNGGMPSSHSATVCALCVMTGFEYGVNGFEFAIALIFAIIVMGDARGVRRETGTQAVVLNEMIDYFKRIGSDFRDFPKPQFSQERLKEFVGHTPLQVFVGALTGVAVAVVMHFIRL